MKQPSSLLRTTLTNQRLYPCILFLVLLTICTNGLAQQWQQAISNTTQNLTKVFYGGGQWVAVGYAGTILTSSDGINWVSQSSNTTEILQNVNYGGGQWVAVGDKGTILTSPDGIGWTVRVASLDQSLYKFSDIGYSEGQWVASGSYNDNLTNKVLTSSDAVNWTVRTIGLSSYKNLKVGKGKWVTSFDGVQTSTDGTSWITTVNRPVRETYSNVYYSGGRWFIYGLFYGGGSSSLDGLTWVGLPFPWRTFGISTFAYNDGLWVAISSGGFGGGLYVSSNGDNWAPAPSPRSARSIEYGMGLWVAVGNGGSIDYNANLAQALPVSLITFQGQSSGANAQITWETSWEKEANYFLIERSRDARSFEAVGRVEAQGTTNLNQHYTFLDKDLNSGLWYYRLRQVDLDGTFTHSQIISLRVGTEPLETLTLSPNPGSASLTVEYKAGIRSVSIYSLTGGLIHEQVFDQAVDQWNWESQAQSAGAYLVRVKAQDGTIRTLRWVKQ